MRVQTVPVFTALTYAQLPVRFQQWLEREHGLSPALADELAAILIERRKRGAEDE